MKKLSIVMAAVMCMAFGINAFAEGPQQFQRPQKVQYVSQVKRAAPVTYVRVRQPQPRPVVIVKRTPPPPQYRYYYHPQPQRVVMVNNGYAPYASNGAAAAVAAGLLGIGLIAAAAAN